MKFGITIIGHDFGGLGLDREEHLDALVARLDVLEKHGACGGGSLLGGGDCETGVDFTAEVEAWNEDPSRAVAGWLAICNDYRAAFPTFDGHIYLSDVDFVTVAEAREMASFGFNLDETDI